MKFAIATSICMVSLLSACQEQPSITNEAKAATSATAATPVVVELYQSQGCSSCPPANRALNQVAGRSDVIALNFSVTYWDRLGWKDSFGKRKYDVRQYGYANALRNRGVYTPQIMVNGKKAIVGNRRGELANEIKATPGVSDGPSITSSPGKVAIGANKGKALGRAEVWLVHYDPRVQRVAIRAGENHGSTLAHKNIVRDIVKLGDWNGRAASFKLPVKYSRHYRSAILVQLGGYRRIISAKVI